MTPVKNVSGKIVAITGASSGIGEATARLLADEGAKVVLGARRTDRLQKLVAEIRAAGGTAEFRPLDVTSRADMAGFVEFAKASFGQLDVLVNNAGIMPLSHLASLQVEEWDQMIDVNIRGVLHGIAAALPGMKAQGFGQFVNLSSIAGHRVIPTSAVYSATKFAVGAISEGLRQENRDIRVTVISPGITESELAGTISDPAVRAQIEEYRKTAITPDAIARAISFAIAQPGDVDVNEIIVRPVAAQ